MALLFTLTLITALGCGLIGGLFLLFNLRDECLRRPPVDGIAALQSINIIIIKSGISLSAWTA